MWCVPQEDSIIILALNDNVADIYIKNYLDLTEQSAQEFLENIRACHISHLQKFIRQFNNIKTNCVLECVYVRNKDTELEERTDANFKTTIEILDELTDLNEYLTRVHQKLTDEMDSFESAGSGWVLESISGLVVRITRYLPLSARGFVKLPKRLADRKAVINIVNPTDECFRYAILSSLLAAQSNEYRYLPNYNKLNHPFNFNNITYPTTLKEIGQFEKDNHVAINVYALDKKNEVYPLRISNYKNGVQHFDLLYLTDGENTHYCLIKDLCRLVKSQISRHEHNHVICRKCFKMFVSDYTTVKGNDAQTRLEEHERFCGMHKPQRIDYPRTPEDAQLYFKNYKHTQHVPVVVYADFECLLIPISGASNDPAKSWSRATHRHEVCSFSLLVKSTVPHYQKDIITYTGPKPVEKFMDAIHGICMDVSRLYKTVVPMKPLTPEQQAAFNAATHCGICEKPFDRDSDTIVHDHCHLTGEFRTAAHSQCNILYQLPSFVPVYFHNLTHYDSHPIILSLARYEGAVSVIPNTSEKYITFSKRFGQCPIECKFVDTFRFMPDSLERLVNNLTEFPNLKEHFPNNFDLIRRKGIYPYSYMDDYAKLSETHLPDKDCFYNDLTGTHISDGDYAHAQTVWRTFNISNMLEYTNLYVTTDVILLCDVFEQFRQITEKHYKIDPSWYLTTPSLGFDAMFKRTNVTLHLFTEEQSEMHLILESSIRGGITSCVTRYAKANTPLLPDYDPSLDESYILYLDVKNLYGSIMKDDPLPIDNFRWLDEDAVKNLDVTTIADDAETGYFLECDIGIPQQLHELMDSFPLFPEHRVPPGGKNTKLLLTLVDKTHYVTHYRNLKFALRLGVVLKKVHRVIAFRQATWLKSYIELNTDLRNKATNAFEKNHFKLLSNCIYGKSIESLRKRQNFSIVTDEKRLLKAVRKPNFRDRIIFAKDVVGISLQKESVYINRPSYVGFTILELSKLKMYSFYYDVILPMYTNRCMELLYIDTDSFFLSVKTNDLYGDLNRLNNVIDFSTYPSTHPCYNTALANTIGIFKDEVNGNLISDFIGLRPKLYSYKVWEHDILKTYKKAKGCQTAFVKNHLTFDNYHHILFNRDKTAKHFATFNSIVSKHHQLYTVNVHRIAHPPLTTNVKYKTTTSTQTPTDHQTLLILP